MNTCTETHLPPLPSPSRRAPTEPDAVLQCHVSYQPTWKKEELYCRDQECSPKGTRVAMVLLPSHGLQKKQLYSLGPSG